jgi:hypothetical protein
LDPELDPVAISTSTSAFPLHFGPPEGPQQAESEVTGTDLQLQHTSECASKGHIWLGKGQNGQLGKMMFQFDVEMAFVSGPALDTEEFYMRPPVGFEEFWCEGAVLQDEDATPIDDDQPPLALMVGHEFKYALVADGAEEITFIVDSGSSHHIFRGRKDLMQDYVNLSTSVSTANNVNGLRAVGHGTLPILVTDVTGNEVRVDLKHVLHAPICTPSIWIPRK